MYYSAVYLDDVELLNLRTCILVYVHRYSGDVNNSRNEKKTCKFSAELILWLREFIYRITVLCKKTITVQKTKPYKELTSELS